MSFNTPSIIEKKREGNVLEDDEINFMIKSIGDKHIHGAQLGAFLMAVYLKGMTIPETITMTKAMVKHGECLEWPADYENLVVDKHSTGGVGDKISLPLAPVLASFGLKVPMISGRGLGFTGGTLDKLESIPGFNVNLTSSQINDIVSKVGCCIVGQTKNIVPADKEMYAARDVTATVSSIPLIVSSIISKKASENLKALVLDVKCGRASFMKNEKDARQLAQWLVDISNGLGITTTAVLTKMDEPIGMTIGNSVEVIESIQCLQGNAPQDLEELLCTLGGVLLASNGKAENLEEGYRMVQNSLSNGSSLKKFQEMLVAQNVSCEVAAKLCDPSTNLWQLLPVEKLKTELITEQDGIVCGLDALALANVLTELGAGRLKPSDQVNHGIGLVLKTRKGEILKKGEVWAVLYHANSLSANHHSTLKEAIKINLQDGFHEQQIESRIIDIVKPTLQ